MISSSIPLPGRLLVIISAYYAYVLRLEQSSSDESSYYIMSQLLTGDVLNSIPLFIPLLI